MGLLNLSGLALLGGALLWTVSLIYGRRRGATDDILKRIMIIAGWVLIAIGLLCAVTVSGPVMIFIAIVVVIMCINRFRHSERRALLWTLAVAAERGIPLSDAVRAFADDSADQTGLRAAKMAELLQAGAALPNALRLSNNRLPSNEMAAVQFGYETGCLAQSIRHLVRQDDLLESRLRSIFEKIVYVVFVVWVCVAIMSFVMISIVPTFDQMFRDFEMNLPALTMLLIELSRSLSHYWFLLSPLALLVVVVLGIGMLQYIGVLPRDFPLIGRLTRRTERVAALRLLALAVRQNQSLAEATRLLAEQYPHKYVRADFQQATQSIDKGVNWCDSLQQARVIGLAEAAVLKSAERVGNLAWALDEMAESMVRRLAYRSAAALNILFPIVVLIVGLIVTLIVVGLFMPLVELIVGLT